jgi:hypothetical protein
MASHPSTLELLEGIKVVKAKFYVTDIQRSHPEAPAALITMGAVCRGAVNSEWASATPSGSLQMTVRNELAVAQFEVGKEYYLTFEEAEPKPVQKDGHKYVFATTSWGMNCCGICGAVGTWVADNGEPYGSPGKYVWDAAAQANHDALYGVDL